MSDLFFQEFYNNVRASDWPNVENYCDFIKLPDTIKNECKNLHRMDARLAQLEDPTYWQGLVNSGHTGWKYKDIVFLPILKCGCNYYNDLFGEQLGWEAVTLPKNDFDNVTVISTIMHPLSRYLKGITEWIWANNLITDFNNAEQCRVTLHALVTQMLISDAHTIPYSMSFPNVLLKMKLIPMDIMSDSEVSQSLTTLFKKLGHDIILPTVIERKHISPPNKLKLFNAVKNQFCAPREGAYLNQLFHLYNLYSHDLKFYRNLVDNFDPTWSSINNTQAS